MKIVLSVFICFLTNSASAQDLQFYDAFWQPCEISKARFYSQKLDTDSGIWKNDYFITNQKPEMMKLFKDKACKIANGPAYHFYVNGQVASNKYYIDNKLHGIALSYYPSGMMKDSGNYQHGKLVGYGISWFQNGFMYDSTTRINDSTITRVRWHDDGTPLFAGIYRNNQPFGTWQYFHNNGQRACIEKYENGKNISTSFFDEIGKALTDTSLVDSAAYFIKGTKGWKAYIESKLHWPNNYKLINTETVTVIVDFEISETGKVENVFVSIPFNPHFDDIATNIIKNSPDWIPAKHRNCNIRAYRRQPITFVQEED